MTNPKSKTTPQERFAKLLKQTSTLADVREFREQCRDVFRLGGIFGLDHWIEARREWKLIHDNSVLKAADDLQAAIGSVIDAATSRPAPQKPTLDADERLRLINEREAAARNNVRFVGCRVTPSVQSRMARGFDQMLDEVIASVRRGAP